MPDIFHLFGLFGDSSLQHDIAGAHTHQDVANSHLFDHADTAHITVDGSGHDVPWLHFGPNAAHHDVDHDRIPDALDHAVGPGADHPFVIGGEANSVPWLNFGPQAMTHDVDHDGIPDALDHQVGFGASDLHAGAMSSGVPWEQITPHAMQVDTDHDGIVDALDNQVGPNI